MSEPEMACGCTTQEKHFTYYSAVCDTWVVLYKGRPFYSLGGGSLIEENVANIVKSLNKAFTLGVEDCGSHLMPQIMAKANEVISSNEIFLVSYVEKLKASFVGWFKTEEEARQFIQENSKAPGLTSYSFPMQFTQLIIEKSDAGYRGDTEIVAFYEFNGDSWVEGQAPDKLKECCRWGFA